MTTPVFSPSAYPAPPLMGFQSAERAETPVPPSSTGMGQDMVRGLALMCVAAIMAVLVLLTQRLLLNRIDMGYWLAGLVLWSVLLSAMLLLSRVSVRLSQTVLSWFDRLALERARGRSRSRLGVVLH